MNNTTNGMEIVFIPTQYKQSTWDKQNNRTMSNHINKKFHSNSLDWLRLGWVGLG
jgi:hypothetical protein